MGPFDNYYNGTFNLNDGVFTSPSQPTSSFGRSKSAVGSALLGFGLDIGKTFLQQYLNNRATDRQNEYNNPINQRKRLEAAGINPYADTAQIASAQRSANYNPAEVKFENASMMMNLKMQEQQIMRNQLEMENQRLQNQGLMFDNDYKQKTLSDRIAQATYATDLANLKIMYQNRVITKTEYDTLLSRLKSEYQSTYNIFYDDMVRYGADRHNPFDKDYWTSDDVNLSIYGAKSLADLWNTYSNVELNDIKDDLLYNQFIDAYWRALRSQIAAQYEQRTGHPFNASSDVEGIYHTLDKIWQTLKNHGLVEDMHYYK